MKGKWSRRVVGYPLLGALLALVLTSGLLFVQAVAAKQWPTLSFLRAQLQAMPLVYLYMAITTSATLCFLGWLWGKREVRLQAGSLTDPLTGLWNRRQLANRLQEETARALRHHTPLSFLLVDLDRLKQLNDRDGHQAGDEALRAVADAIRRSCRRSDVPARYGGDEFAVLAPSTAEADAAALGERIRVTVRDMAHQAIHNAVKGLSVSIGVADLSDVESPSVERQNELPLAADRALYLAKQRGRNCVVCAREGVSGVLEQAIS
jgi:diguanylate cyclase (GGDEF)-like protein